MNPQILVNGEQERQDVIAAAEELICSITLHDECPEDAVDAEKEKHAKMQSVLKQVREKIRSQAGTRAPKSGGIMELVQRVRDRESAQVNGVAEGGEDQKQETLAGEEKTVMEQQEENFCAVFDSKLGASEKALREEFEVQISQVRKEMQTYTDQALKDLQVKLQSRQPHKSHQTHPREQAEIRGPDRRQWPAAGSTLASRRGRVLTRTMTTIIPKTCAPVIVGPRAKSETLSSSKGESSQLLPRDPHNC
ncbi:hypothetical protein EXN66_Car011698 [Xyrichtys novacula]|uniref:Uncharacterized protein n=1 Tax=Xyrichtys novacula TaxID=13765 RepID=A0AAV1G5Z6_XYRNO|nr:hypothetical protein EXN66_Car011698 [Xyrichtys novacula]